MSDSVNVYAEAKTEYTRQLCQILTPAFHIYFLDLFKYAKDNTKDFLNVGWEFQDLLQGIPDWSQDKVLRETEKIIRDSRCDYLEELLTAVFIAHTKVLSAIRITSKQKKLQLTIPKMDHFLHRTLRESGRLLWGNTFLFLDEGNSIERQKNMRQIESLIQEGIQQSIRSLLPVKTILREYLNDDEEEDTETTTKKKEEDDDEDEKENEEEEKKPEETKPAEETSEEVKIQEVKIQEVKQEENKPTTPIPEEVKSEEVKSEEVKSEETKPAEEKSEETKPLILIPKVGKVNITKEDTPPTPVETQQQVVPQPQVQPQSQVPTLVVETEPSVSFTNMDTIFHSDNPERNEITESYEEIETIETLNLPPEPMDDFEELA